MFEEGPKLHTAFYCTNTEDRTTKLGGIVHNQRQTTAEKEESIFGNNLNPVTGLFKEACETSLHKKCYSNKKSKLLLQFSIKVYL